MRAKPAFAPFSTTCPERAIPPGSESPGKNRVGERVDFREAHQSTMEVEVMQNLAHNRRLIIGLVLAIAVIAVIVLIVAYSGGGGGGGY